MCITFRIFSPHYLGIRFKAPRLWPVEHRGFWSTASWTVVVVCVHVRLTQTHSYFKKWQIITIQLMISLFCMIWECLKCKPIWQLKKTQWVTTQSLSTFILTYWSAAVNEASYLFRTKVRFLCAPDKNILSWFGFAALLNRPQSGLWAMESRIFHTPSVRSHATLVPF